MTGPRAHSFGKPSPSRSSSPAREPPARSTAPHASFSSQGRSAGPQKAAFSMDRSNVVSLRSLVNLLDGTTPEERKTTYRALAAQIPPLARALGAKPLPQLFAETAPDQRAKGYKALAGARPNRQTQLMFTAQADRLRALQSAQIRHRLDVSRPALSRRRATRTPRLSRRVRRRPSSVRSSARGSPEGSSSDSDGDPAEPRYRVLSGRRSAS